MRWNNSCSFVAVSLIALLAPVPAVAQDNNTTLRVDKLEKEMRAVQRKVFGTSGAVVEPDMGVSQPTTPGPGSSAPVADLTARVDALEAQLAKLTGTVEENSFKLRQLENRFAAMQATNNANAGATQVSNTAASTTSLANSAQSTARPTTTTTPVKQAPSSDRLARVKAVEVPSTGNAAEDAYTYGYRLWDAKFYPEAQAQLQKVVADYPNYSRMSFARNLLGRAYMDDGQNENAVHAFYDNYKKLPNGDRAADSLMYLGVTFSKMKNKQAACTAFTELFKNYDAKMSSSVKSQATAERAKAGCS